MAVKICSDPEPFVQNIYTFPTGAIYKRLSFFFFFAPFDHLPAIVSVRIDNYSEHNGLRYFSVQVAVQFQRPSGSSFSMKMKMSFCFFYAIYYFPTYTILNVIFLEQKNHTHLK